MNQCDGCRAGWELRDGLHYDRHGTVQMTCTATRYPLSANAIKTLPNGDTEAFSLHITSMVPEQTEAYAHETDTETLIRTSNLPRPLFLAEALERTMQWPLHGKAADELRRLHQSEREGWRYAAELEQQQKADESLLRQALDTLAYWLEHGETPGAHDMIQRTHDALQERLIPLGVGKGVGKREHITDGSPCWCNPETTYTDPDTGVSVIVHKEPQ